MKKPVFLLLIYLVSSVTYGKSSTDYYKIPITKPALVCDSTNKANMPIRKFKFGDSIVIKKIVTSGKLIKTTYCFLTQNDSLISPRDVLETLGHYDSLSFLAIRIEKNARNIQRTRSSKIISMPLLIGSNGIMPFIIPGTLSAIYAGTTTGIATTLSLSGGRKYKEAVMLWEKLIAQYNELCRADSFKLNSDEPGMVYFKQINAYLGVGPSLFFQSKWSSNVLSLKGGVHERNSHLYGGYTGFITIPREKTTTYIYGGYGFFGCPFNLYRDIVYGGPTIHAGYLFIDSEDGKSGDYGIGAFGGPGASLIIGKGFCRLTIDYIMHFGGYNPSSFFQSLTACLSLSL